MALANAAIDYFGGAYSTAGKRLMGRDVASEAFLRAFFQHGEVEHFYCLADTAREFDEFAALCRKTRDERRAAWIRRHAPDSLPEAGCLFHGDPVLGKLAWQRRHYGERAYSLCGVTHTICTQAVMDAIAGLVTAPLYEWDAVVCTSRAVRSTVETLLSEWSEYLRVRLGECNPPRVQLPVIPLGVDTALFDDPHGDRTRLQVRRSLGIHAEEFVVLYVGRLAFHAKAHPWQMYMALERAAQRTQKSLCLVQAGWFPNAEIEAEFKTRARAICPRVKTVYVDGNHPDFRRRIWQAADVFVSLADNIQETFGLAPVEAMAAGLPSVVSDWDGYKDTVRHGIDGFRVPVITPSAGSGEELAWRYERGEDDYDRYIGAVSLCTAIDVEACAGSIVRLIESPALQISMGKAAREHARSDFDWKHVVRAYQELWHELQSRRAAGASAAAPFKGPANPLRPDPFALFATYPTAQLEGSTVFDRQPAAEHWLTEIYRAPMTNFAPSLFASIDESRRILALLENGPRAASELLAGGIVTDRRKMERTLMWLVKGGVLAVVG